ncbi:transglutaminase-like domain-containing protein [Tenacibaculum sp. MEBiC06402]|uniref:transglutaminase-like domain-containing protein n=1 Tax=unclassified Tenacibaculum TaxID=2635139 RepID=UPI003B9A1901
MSENIEIKEDSSFVRNVSVIFQETDKPFLYPIFYDAELEKISNVKLYVKKKRRDKPISKIETYEEDAKLDFITSTKIKFVIIPANKEIKLSYSSSCKELMYFSSLPFFSHNKIDTLNYRVQVPNQFNLVHNTIYKESLSFYKIDSTKTELNSAWNIKVSPKEIEPDPLHFFRVYKNMKNPLMRIIVTPNSYKNRPTNYINDWYLGEVSSKKGLNNEVKQKIDALTKNVTNPSQIVNTLYNYVRSNFKYVMIELGMGAFVPTHANTVYYKKEGDCKDLSNFLSEALNYKGIKSDIALAATFDHISDCNFPSLSSANHVITTAYVNDEVILLDPTDPIHREGTPVESLQDRTILIVNNKGGIYHKVKSFTPEQNRILYQLDLKVDNTDIKGEFEVLYEGISSNFLKYRFKDKNKKERIDFEKTFFEVVFRNQAISNLELLYDTEKLAYKGNISVSSKTFDDDKNKYLFIDFLPKIIETESRDSFIEGINAGNPFHKIVQAKITVNEPITDFKPIIHTYKEEGISLNVTIKPISNLEIECTYDFTLNHIYLEEENVNKANEILKSFKKIINEPIILEKQKS